VALFDFLGKKKGESQADVAKPKSAKEIARLERLVGTKLTQNYDRQEAIEELCKIGTAASAAALLKRFGWSMDPSITDHEEKENAVRGIAAAGEAAIDPIRAYCKRAESLTWPLKALRQVVGEDELGDELLALLDLFDTEYVRNPEPKVQLITALEEYRTDEVRIAVEPFLGDASEPVRFSAVGTVLSMNAAASVPALVAALEQEESLRVKNRLAQGLVDKGWSVGEDLRDTCQKSLPPGYRLSDGVVRRS
jgi:HEAT repeat protein